MAVALCPGSFDPPTNGHVDVVERAARYFDSLVVAVIANPSKEALFSLDQRKDLLAEGLAHVSTTSRSTASTACWWTLRGGGGSGSW